MTGPVRLTAEELTSLARIGWDGTFPGVDDGWLTSLSDDAQAVLLSSAVGSLLASGALHRVDDEGSIALSPGVAVPLLAHLQPDAQVIVELLRGDVDETRAWAHGAGHWFVHRTDEDAIHEFCQDPDPVEAALAFLDLSDRHGDRQPVRARVAAARLERALEERGDDPEALLPSDLVDVVSLLDEADVLVHVAWSRGTEEEQQGGTLRIVQASSSLTVIDDADTDDDSTTFEVRPTNLKEVRTVLAEAFGA